MCASKYYINKKTQHRWNVHVHLPREVRERGVPAVQIGGALRKDFEGTPSWFDGRLRPDAVLHRGRQHAAVALQKGFLYEL